MMPQFARQQSVSVEQADLAKSSYSMQLRNNRRIRCTVYVHPSPTGPPCTDCLLLSECWRYKLMPASCEQKMILLLVKRKSTDIYCFPINPHHNASLLCHNVPKTVKNPLVGARFDFRRITSLLTRVWSREKNMSCPRCVARKVGGMTFALFIYWSYRIHSTFRNQI